MDNMLFYSSLACKKSVLCVINVIIIRYKFFFLCIGRTPTTWPANNSLQIMVCSCAMSPTVFSFKCLAESNILLMRKRTHAFLLLAIALSSRMADRFASRRYFLKSKLGDRMIKQLLNSVIAKYRDFSVSRRSIICLSLRLRQIIDLLATDKSRYFAQPRPIIANYWFLILFFTLSSHGIISQHPYPKPILDWLSLWYSILSRGRKREDPGKESTCTVSLILWEFKLTCSANMTNALNCSAASKTKPESFQKSVIEPSLPV